MASRSAALASAPAGGSPPSEELEAIISRVRTELQPLITSPTLASRLLAKPPFRFIHDIVSSVIQSTGFGTGAIPAELQDARALTTREQKLAYLEVLLQLLTRSAPSDPSLAVQPSKILQGAEPEATNRMLLLLARSAKEHGNTAKKQSRGKLSRGPDASPASSTVSGAGRTSTASTSSAFARLSNADTFQRGALAAAAAAEASAAATTGAFAPPTAAPTPSYTTSNPDAAGAALSAQPNSSAVSATASNPVDLDACIALTIAMVQPLITTPHLLPRLLAKPPFRFLHDVVSALMNTTGWGAGLFTPTELDAEAIRNDKEAKIAYLEKLRDAIGIQLGVYVAARPTKIVAGFEPEKTNELLQLLAQAVGSVAGGANAVRRVLSGEKQQQQPLSANSTTQQQKPVAAPTQAPIPPPQQAQTTQRPSINTTSTTNATTAVSPQNSMETSALPPAAAATSTSFARPMTATRRAPLPRRAAVEAVASAAVEATALAQSSSSASAYAPTIASEAPSTSGLFREVDTNQAPDIAIADASDARQTDFVGELSSHTAGSKNTISSSGGENGGIRLGNVRLHGRQPLPNLAQQQQMKSTDGNSNDTSTNVNDIDTLQSALQTLCANAVPLGAGLGFVVDDLSEMKRELASCANDIAILTTQLEAERRETAKMLNPSIATLRELEMACEEVRTRLGIARCSIVRGDEKMHALIKSMAHAGLET